VTERPLKNVAASVRQRLMNSAKALGRPFQEVLQYFAMERFLYRLSQSQHAERFILKGALLFNLWGAPSSRPTRDIDLLGRLNNSVDTDARRGHCPFLCGRKTGRKTRPLEELRIRVDRFCPTWRGQRCCTE